MRIYTHPACTRHDPGPGHAERPLRLVAVTEALRENFPALEWEEAPRASRGKYFFFCSSVPKSLSGCGTPIDWCAESHAEVEPQWDVTISIARL